MNRFQWYRKLRGGYWVCSEKIYDNSFWYDSWKKVSKEVYHKCFFCWDKREDWSK